MKKRIYLFSMALFVLAFCNINMLFGQVQRETSPPVVPLKWGGDVIVHNDPTFNQQNAKLAVAFNGWLYSVFSSQNGTSCGVTIMRSKDNGANWSLISNNIYANSLYKAVDAIVCGTDTNNLRLFVGGILYTGTNYVVWVDRYNATTGIQIDEPYGYSSPSIIYDLALASDYLLPSSYVNSLSQPFGVGLVYTKRGGSQDSVMFVGSGDAGATFNSPNVVYSTSYWLGKVDMSYGANSSWFLGRFYVAFEQFTSLSDSVGAIFTAYAPFDNPSTFVGLVRLDTVGNYPSVIGKCRRPSIACQQSSNLNDSTGLTSVVVFERQYTPTDCDVLGCATKSSPNDNHWGSILPLNGSDNEVMGNISFDPGYNNFLLTYYNSTTGYLPFMVKNFNLPNPSTWGVLMSHYNDNTSDLTKPFPRVEINPVALQCAFTWTANPTANGVTMFDAEYSLIVGIKELEEQGFSVSQFAPNPAVNTANLDISLNENSKVTAILFDQLGRQVILANDSEMGSGNQRLSIDVSELPAGMYYCMLIINGQKLTRKLTKF
ncbi:MAG: T9SS type A sorting domain-containing protein [Bacteroidota bacterium]